MNMVGPTWARRKWRNFADDKDETGAIPDGAYEDRLETTPVLCSYPESLQSIP